MKVSATQAKSAQLRRQLDLWQEAVSVTLRAGHWQTDYENGPVSGPGVVRLSQWEIETLEAWRKRMSLCARTVHIIGCPSGHNHAAYMCCQVPMCPIHMRKLSRQWTTRARTLWDMGLRNGDTVTRTKEVKPPGGRRRRRGEPKVFEARTYNARWRLVTLAIRHSGDITTDVKRTLELRRALMRKLRKDENRDAYGAIELGPGNGNEGHVHLHMLTYGPYVPREELQDWFSKWDGPTTCKIPGCHHPGDDRCDECKAKKVTCSHPHECGRERCRSSWYVDIRQICCRGCRWCTSCAGLRAQKKKTPKGCKVCADVRRRCDHDGAKEALIEGLKYAAAPADHSSKGELAPEVGNPSTRKQVAHAIRVLRYFVALYKRHRVETFGAARIKVDGEEENQTPGLCATCGARESVVSIGYRAPGTFSYSWRIPVTPFQLSDHFVRGPPESTNKIAA